MQKIKKKGTTLQDFLKKLDFENLEKLTACEIGFDEDVDLGLHAVNDPDLKQQESESEDSSPKYNNRRAEPVARKQSILLTQMHNHD